ncbi:MAG TPA: redox-regulated ATPase YchF [Methermicoccus shengliensis]|uniref:Redox-regulated ATPase YchF n=1 Tax=Methermicoccus shengliensis TaxID=660064 RepID=A0A832RX63_9EURY|nr:redox-regulated ATPase YchF [Methermicoccus shengliensis]KUK04738.1 MAG: GTP-binding protein [Euryarchaeota archaeon 55_53]KUK29820.1 MAG: GTP-binding protein [Methanosarcinales archeaon 56_1174]MDI3487402.1 ribosome-binding ATPase [Methanosarcinales archaeon]MDN5295269.1 ribosome-binding ATPase [Methanosarcinales archaeon]HIH69642.1 redox-regulated ATPase YchF [Methermicoccus shengliensis]
MGVLRIREVALAGKPNCGKSTFFKAATLANVEIANYPFTTIDANIGISSVRVDCPCLELDERCGQCREGARFVPVGLIDVAGLVHDAHKGRGLGNAFLDRLREASSIVHVVDASGSTDAEGNPVGVGSHDPLEDVDILERELTYWMMQILVRGWDRLARRVQAEHTKIEHVIAEQLSGVGVSQAHVRAAISELGLPSDKPAAWHEHELLDLCDYLRSVSKPMLIAANKMDTAPEENLKRLKELHYTVVPTSAEAELVLRMAERAGLIEYVPGDGDFRITGTPTEKQLRALERVGELLERFGSTGVQECLNRAVLELLGLIVVYPVEDEAKWTDKDGRVLPDAFLMPRGSTPRDLAYEVHTELGEGFLYAVDGRTGRRLGESYELKSGDVIKIVAVK